VALVRPEELIAYAVLGIAGGLASGVFSSSIATLRPRLKALPKWTQYFQPAVAGLMIGMIGVLGFPQVMGAGYEFIDQAIHGQFTWQVLGILAGLKILATALSFASGTPGGMFAPTLFTGAMLGAAVGGVEQMFFPHLSGSAGTYALVGMGVLFAGFLRAPMTSVFMALEVSGNYSIILPVIVANTFAYVIARALQPVPIFDLLTRQEGLDLPSMEEQREENILRVEDAMRPVTIPVLSEEESLDRVLGQVEDSASDNLLVSLSSAGWSTITKQEVKTMVGEGKGNLSLGSVVPIRRLPRLHPDHPLDVALRYVNQWAIVPVVSRADFSKLEGIISREDVLSACRAVDEESN
jgi:CIC family chloride channel protein